VSTDPGAEEGLERLRAAARSNPRSTAFVALAHALCDHGREDEAEEVCRQGLLQHPRLVTGQVALGRALIARHHWGEAKEVLVNAAKANPEHGEAFRWLGDLILQQGDANRARALLEYAEELMPGDGQVADLLAEAGGKPLSRTSRPLSDFEHTRVKDARALAERMHEDPPAPPNGASASTGSLDDDRTPVVEPLNQFDPAAAPTPPVESLPAIPTGAMRTPWLRALALLGAVGLAVLLVLAVMRDRPGPVDPSADRPGPAAGQPIGSGRAVDLGPLRRDILDSSLASLQRVRAVGMKAGWGGPADGDLAATVAFADSLLASDWGLPVATESLQAAESAERARPASASRTALLESARAITAAAHGRLGDARAGAERALAAGAGGHEARFAGGRVKFLAGELGAARVDLERALDSAPSFGAAALDHAAVLIDAGEAATSAAELEKYLAQRRTDVRARLLLAEAGRAAARSVDREAVRSACKDQGSTPPPVRAFCALDAAASARLEGDRAGAVKNARSAAVSGVLGLHAARGAAQAALLLASLGEIDAASEALGKVKDHVGTSFAPRVWAEAAVALGRGEKVSSATLATPPGPEARLVAARMAFAQGGPAALAATLGRMGPAAVDYDPELKSFSALAVEGRLSARLRADLDRRAAKGSAVAAYVAGRSALAAGDRRTAGRRLARALRGHGDACEAARLLLTIDRRSRPSSVSSESRIASALKGRSSGCVHLRK
jgi:tetratricopeptide (TPR) repeat protein